MISVEGEGTSVDDAIESTATDGLSKVGVTVPGSTPDVSRETHGGVSETASRILRDMLGHLVDDPRIEVSADESGAITLSVVSQDGGSIIGRRGQTLDALEHLVNRIVFRDDKAAPGRITIDVEGYRRRREESLRDLARRLGQKARETGQVVIVNPLSPRDRRIVHLELEADPNVTTRSEGEGLFRRLLIVPETGSTRR